MRFIQICRRWLSQAEIPTFDDFEPIFKKNFQERQQQFDSELSKYEWKVFLDDESYLILKNDLQVKPAKTPGKYEKRENGEWKKIDPRNFPTDDLMRLQKSVQAFVELVDMRRDMKEFSTALGDFKQSFDLRIREIENASRLRRIEALEQLRSYYRDNRQVLPRAARLQALDLELRIYLTALKEASPGEKDQAVRALYAFLDEHRDELPLDTEKEIKQAEAQKELQLALDEVIGAGTRELADAAEKKARVTYQNFSALLGSDAEAAIGKALDRGCRNFPPATPGEMRASDGKSDGVHVFWKPVLGAMHYGVFYAETKTAEPRWIENVPADKTEYVHKSAKPETELFYWVRAENGAGVSPYAGPMPGRREKPELVSQAPPPPATPAGPSEEASDKMRQCLDEADVCGALEVYRSNLAHGAEWIESLEVALRDRLEGSKSEAEENDPVKLAELKELHERIDAGFKTLSREEKNLRRSTTIKRLSQENSLWLKQLNSLLQPKQVEASKPTAPVVAAVESPPAEVKLPEPSKPVEIIEPVKPVQTAKAPEVVKPVEAPKDVEPVKPVEVLKTPETSKPVETIKPAEAVLEPEPAKPLEATKPVGAPRQAEAVKAPEPVKLAEAPKPVETVQSAKPAEAQQPPKTGETPGQAEAVLKLAETMALEGKADALALLIQAHPALKDKLEIYRSLAARVQPAPIIPKVEPVLPPPIPVKAPEPVTPPPIPVQPAKIESPQPPAHVEQRQPNEAEEAALGQAETAAETGDVKTIEGLIRKFPKLSGLTEHLETAKQIKELKKLDLIKAEGKAGRAADAGKPEEIELLIKALPQWERELSRYITRAESNRSRVSKKRSKDDEVMLKATEFAEAGVPDQVQELIKANPMLISRLQPLLEKAKENQKRKGGFFKKIL